MISIADETCVVRTSFSSAIISKVEGSFHEAYTFESLELGTNLAPWGKLALLLSLWDKIQVSDGPRPTGLSRRMCEQ